MPYGTPDVSSVIAEAIASALLGLRVATVGIVKTYDAATQTCSVQPAVRRPVDADDDTVLQEADSIIQNVMVGHWGAAALSSHATLAAGDAVLLVYLDYSPAVWRARGVLSDTPDTHAHRYPVALPFYRPSGGAGGDTDLSIGEPDGTRVRFESGVVRVGATVDPAADFVALAAKVDARLTALEAFAASHTHPVPGVTTGPGAAVSSPAAGAPTGASVAATKLKSG